jgi:hypothetical protein
MAGSSAKEADLLRRGKGLPLKTDLMPVGVSAGDRVDGAVSSGGAFGPGASAVARTVDGAASTGEASGSKAGPGRAVEWAAGCGAGTARTGEGGGAGLAASCVWSASCLMAGEPGARPDEEADLSGAGAAARADRRTRATRAAGASPLSRSHSSRPGLTFACHATRTWSSGWSFAIWANSWGGKL